MKTKPSVIDQLKLITKNLQDLEFYSYDVNGDDLNDAIFYSKLQDQINEKIIEFEEESKWTKWRSRNSNARDAIISGILESLVVR